MGNNLALPPSARELAKPRRVSGAHQKNPLHFAPRKGVMFSAVIAVVLGFLMVNTIDPSSGAVASPYYSFFEATRIFQTQSLVTGDGSVAIGDRDSVGTIVHLAPVAGVPDPGSAQAIAYVMVAQRGWSSQDFDCLVSLWNRESHWNVYSNNTSSGAYGIPQALPGSKMASAGADWRTSARTQITWGLHYIAARYATPCGAWQHSQETGWY